MNGLMKHSKRMPGLVAAALAFAVLAAGCSTDRDNDSQPEPTSPTVDGRQYVEGMLGEDASGTPNPGGTLRFAAFSEPASLDPSRTLMAGGPGGIEMINIFDTLMRYDTETQSYVPQLVDALTANEDHTVWTLTLREGVTFHNGKPLNAQAVKDSQDRYAERSGPESALWIANVEDIEVIDERTVQYTLARPWPLFVGILSSGPGMVVSVDSGADEDFVPIGAGPFVFESRAPQENLILSANPDYWAGEPALEQVRVVYLPTEDAKVDALRSDGVDVAMLRSPKWVDQLQDEGVRGYNSVPSASNMALINASAGRPGEDVRVRKAMALALDPRTVADRANDGYGIADSTLFGDYSRWTTSTRGLEPDVDEAKALLEAAKADGYDGTVTYLDFAAPDREAIGLAFKASLEAVGFEVTIDLVRVPGDRVAQVSRLDYDVAGWGQSYREADPFSKMYTTMHSAGNQLWGSHTSPEMDALLEAFQASADEAEQLEIMDRIQQLFNEEVPFLNWGPIAEFVAWNDNVHGVIGATNSTVLFSEAWLS